MNFTKSIATLGVLAGVITACALATHDLYYPKLIPENSRRPDMGFTPIEKSGKPSQGNMYWNVWAEEGEAITLQPVKVLKRNTNYLLAIDLSGWKYTDPSDGIRNSPASQSTTEHLEKWALEAKESSVDLRVIMVPDVNYFSSLGVTSIDFPVSAEKVALFTSRRPLSPEMPLSRTNPKQDGSVNDYGFARQTIRITTGDTEGVGSIAFLVWSKLERPLDEFAVRFCIADGDSSRICSASDGSIKTVFEGMSAFLIRDDTLPTPDIAIQFFQLDSGSRLKGILHEKGKDFSDSIVWNVESTANDLSSRYQNRLLREIGSSSSENELLRNGAALFDSLFPNNSNARTVIESMFNAEKSSSKKKTVLVRLLQDSPDPPLIIPFGLMAPRAANHRPLGFLGSRVKVETPLEFQTPLDYPKCIDKWKILLPPSTYTEGDLKDTSIGQALSLILGKNSYENPIHQIATWKEQHQSAFPSWDIFRDWLAQDNVPFEPQVMAILSHHDQNKLYIDAATYLQDGDFLRRFKTSSVAILAGCGVAEPGGSHIIRALNQSGVTAIVTAASSISSFMGVTFLDCLSKSVQDNSQMPDYRLSDGFEQALVCVSNSTIPGTTVKYGSNAYKFTLLGNGYTRICPPI